MHFLRGGERNSVLNYNVRGDEGIPNFTNVMNFTVFMAPILKNKCFKYNSAVQCLTKSKVNIKVVFDIKCVSTVWSCLYRNAPSFEQTE